MVLRTWSVGVGGGLQLCYRTGIKCHLLNKNYEGFSVLRYYIYPYFVRSWEKWSYDENSLRITGLSHLFLLKTSRPTSCSCLHLLCGLYLQVLVSAEFIFLLLYFILAFTWKVLTFISFVETHRNRIYWDKQNKKLFRVFWFYHFHLLFLFSTAFKIYFFLYLPTSSAQFFTLNTIFDHQNNFCRQQNFTISSQFLSSIQFYHLGIILPSS